jgi:hypothetical protein
VSDLPVDGARAPLALSPQALGYLRSATRWAIFLALAALGYGALTVYSFVRIWQIGAGIPLALRWDILVYVLPGFVLPLGQLVLTVSYAVAARAFVRGHARSLAPALRSLRYLLVVFFVAAVIGLLGAAHNIYDRLHPIRDAEPAAFSERRP